jgi:hypothetical protein
MLRGYPFSFVLHVYKLGFPPQGSPSFFTLQQVVTTKPNGTFLILLPNIYVRHIKSSDFEKGQAVLRSEVSEWCDSAVSR